MTNEHPIRIIGEVGFEFGLRFKINNLHSFSKMAKQSLKVFLLKSLSFYKKTIFIRFPSINFGLKDRNERMNTLYISYSIGEVGLEFGLGL